MRKYIPLPFLCVICFHAAAQDLLLFDGETPDIGTCAFFYGEADSTEAFAGAYCFKGIPDQWHSPGINLQCQGAWREDLSGYDELRFHIKATEQGQSAAISIYGWPHTSPSVDISPYFVAGGGLDTVYKEVRLPLDSLKTPDYNLGSVEILYFGVSPPGENYQIFVDDIWAVDTRPNRVDTFNVLSHKTLHLEIQDSYDTIDVKMLMNYSLYSPTDLDFQTPQLPVDVGMRYYVKGFVPNTAVAVPIRAQELYLLFDKEMKTGHAYSLVVDNVRDLSTNDFPSPQAFDFVYDDLDYINGSVKTNHIGYQADSWKYAYIGNYLGSAGALDLQLADIPVFELRDAVTHAVVYTGAPAFRASDDRLSGEEVYDCDFSAFNTPGSYYIYVPNMGRSHDFDININVYDKVYEKTMKCFYYQRHDMPLIAPYADAGYERGGCPTLAEIDVSHTASSLFDPSTDYPVGTQLNITGGWFDAGDYGRYVPTAAVSLNTLFNAYEMYPARFPDNHLNIPESGNGIPDMLDEAKYELDWLLQMQAPDGGVYYKVTTTAYANSMPEDDTPVRYIAEKTTFSTALFAATMAAAYRQYSPYSPSFADTCLARAELAWQFLQVHPTEVPVGGYTNQGNVGGGAYTDPSGDVDDRAWAAAELYKSTGLQAYHDAFELYWLQNASDYGWNGFQHHQKKASWAYATTTLYPINSAYRDDYVSKVEISLDNYLIPRANANAYRNSYRSDVIPWIGWGSFAQSTEYSFEFIKGYHLLGKPEYLDYARLNFDTQLGNNPQHRSYITSLGHDAPQDPTHHPSDHDGVAAPIPGIPVFGPHSHIPMSNSYYIAAQTRENLYPSGETDNDPYPTLRRYYDMFELVHMSEFSIEYIAETSVAFAYFSTADAPVLPVEFTEVGARCEGGGVAVFWTTASERANDFFILEKRGLDGQWRAFAQVDGHGDSASPNSYSSVDEGGGNGGIYRIKQVDFDGNFSYSKIVSASCDGVGEWYLFPNPATHTLNLRSDGKTPLGVLFYDMAGRLVWEGDFSAAERNVDISHLPKGIYMAKLRGLPGARKFVKW